MRFAFFSDIHANFLALELILADIRSLGVDQTVCLGDVASLGPQPRETVECLQDLHIPIIMGNHDGYLLDLSLTKSHEPWLRETEQWGREQLTDSHLAYLQTFQPSLRFVLDRCTSVFCFHGSPRSNEEFLLPTASPASLEEAFGEETARVLVGGHTHVQMLRNHKESTFLNPGSAGMPFEFPQAGRGPRGLPWAEYALLDVDRGRISVDLRRLPFEFSRLAQLARASGIPDVEYWLTMWAPACS